MPPKPPTVLTTALSLHDRDFWIVPTSGKGPIWNAWHKQRRTREELEAALEGNASLGIAIVLNQSDLIDVECDTPEAEAALQSMFADGIPAAPTWASARGKHRLFRRPAGLPERSVIEVDGIEFKIGNGKGACAIVPPSLHANGQRRRWLAGCSLDDVEPAELPPEVVERLRAPAPVQQSSDNGSGIAEGERNKALFARGCQFREMGLDETAIAAMLGTMNANLCKPPLSVEEVNRIAHSAATGNSKVGSDFVAGLMRELELWHDQNSDPFVTLPQGEHVENWALGSRPKPFRRWVSKRYYEKMGGMLTSGDLSDLCSMLEGKAVYDGAECFVWRRVGRTDDAFYLDLAEPEWRVVEIDGKGWRVVAKPPVKFRRAKAMSPMPAPVVTAGTELKSLLTPFLNVRADQWPLIVAWLVAALRPTGPYAILKLLGEQGSAKTTTARVLRSLIDPNAAPVRAEPRSTRDLMIAANNGWVLCLDNLSMIKPDLSDALCRLSTGGGFSTRTLYTDDEESIFDAMRPVILTSIEEIGTRSDLLERCLIVELPPIADGHRRAEKTFWAEFEAVKPRVLGALLDGVSGAIRRLPEIEKRADVDLPRLADFYTWANAAEESFGFEPGTFAEAYAANRASATCVALESSPVAAELLRYLKEKKPTVEETAARLLELLERFWIGSENKTKPGWPKNPRSLSAILKRIAPNLRQIGVLAEQRTRGGGNAKEKVWRIMASKEFLAGSQGSKGSKKTPKVLTKGTGNATKA